MQCVWGGMVGGVHVRETYRCCQLASHMQAHALNWVASKSRESDWSIDRVNGCTS